MMDGFYDGMGAGGWILMTVFWVVLLVVIVWAVVQLFPRGGTGASDAPPLADPRAILDTRLARGEIDPETYDELRARLEDSRRETHAVGG